MGCVGCSYVSAENQRAQFAWMSWLYTDPFSYASPTMQVGIADYCSVLHQTNTYEVLAAVAGHVKLPLWALNDTQKLPEGVNVCHLSRQLYKIGISLIEDSHG